jgi:hypothetical protein
MPFKSARQSFVIVCTPIPSLSLALAPLGAVGRKKVQPESARAEDDSEEEDSDEEMEEDGRQQHRGPSHRYLWKGLRSSCYHSSRSFGCS